MISRTIRHTAIWALLMISLMVVFFQAMSLFSLYRNNQLLDALVTGKDVDVSQVISGKPELRLARAYYLKQKHRYDEALATLSLILDQGDNRFKATVFYNLGNIYLEQAVAKVEIMAMNEALPLAGLAKQAYRKALALDSGFWDAKYNLEVAMRLLPEMDRLNMQDDEPTNNQQSQLWTTVPGFPRGLP